MDILSESKYSITVFAIDDMIYFLRNWESLFHRFIYFHLHNQNLVDLSTIAPFWILLTTTGIPNRTAAFMRVLRCLRVFKVLRRVPSLQMMMEMIFATLEKSMPALSVMVVLLILGELLIYFPYILILFCNIPWNSILLYHCPVWLFLLSGMIFFGTLIYNVERGQFTVNEKYPTGSHIRPAIDQGATKHVSIFYMIGWFEGLFWSMTNCN